MGDKSPRSKQRGLQQKDATKAQNAASAKAKQDHQSWTPQPRAKGKA